MAEARRAARELGMGTPATKTAIMWHKWMEPTGVPKVALLEATEKKADSAVSALISLAKAVSGLGNRETDLGAVVDCQDERIKRLENWTPEEGVDERVGQIEHHLVDLERRISEIAAGRSALLDAAKEALETTKEVIASQKQELEELKCRLPQKKSPQLTKSPRGESSGD